MLRSPVAETIIITWPNKRTTYFLTNSLVHFTAAIISLFLFVIEEMGEEQQNQEGIEENAQRDSEEGIHFFFS